MKAGLTLLLAGMMAVLGVRAGAQEGERYAPGIWIDPDGCEHWVMDDGVEGFMSPHLRRDGTPVCHRVNRCATVPTDPLFASGSARLATARAGNIRAFFESNRANGYVIEGHTDNRGSDGANMALSERRARAVAEIARQAGARVYAARGFGERRPAASNASAAGRAANRRVDILCLR